MSCEHSDRRGPRGVPLETPAYTHGMGTRARSHAEQLHHFQQKHGTADVAEAILARAAQLKRFVKQRRATVDARDAICQWKLAAQRLADDGDKAERDVGRMLTELGHSGGLRAGEVSLTALTNRRELMALRCVDNLGQAYLRQVAELLQQRADDDSSQSSYASWLREQVHCVGAIGKRGPSHTNQLVRHKPGNDSSTLTRRRPTRADG